MTPTTASMPQPPFAGNPPRIKPRSHWDSSPSTLKAHLVLIGLRALSKGDEARVELITRLLREEGLCHE
jgi:hypothetical protein